MQTTDVLVALAIAVGLVGIVVPVLPGSVLILGAVLVWTLAAGSTTAWLFFAGATAFLAVGAVVKYTVPGRRLSADGVPRTPLVVGSLLGIVGFFVVPVVGLVLGFVLGVYLAEVPRVGVAAAWPTTRRALSAVGLSILIELAAGLFAAMTWAVGAVLV